MIHSALYSDGDVSEVVNRSNIDNMEGQENTDISNDNNNISVNKRSGRQLPAVPSKIPVRRDQSLPSSGRSTPCLPPAPRPGIKREGSSPPGLLFTGTKPRPPVGPKPSLNIVRPGAVVSPSPGSASKIPRPRPDPVTSRLKKWDSTSALEVRKSSSYNIEHCSGGKIY